MKKPKRTDKRLSANRAALHPDREAAFVHGLVVDRKSQTQAYLDAGYTAKSSAVACSTANIMMKRPGIQKQIAVLRKKIAEKYELNEQNVFKALGSILNADMRNYSQWGPKGVTLVDSKDLTEAQALAVEEVSETVGPNGGAVKFKLASKTRAAEIGARLLGLLDREQNSTPNITVNILNYKEAYDGPSNQGA